MDLDQERVALNYQNNRFILVAVKERMMHLAKAVTIDKTILSDLSEMADYFFEDYMEHHFDKHLSVKQVDEYAMITFKDIANGYEKYVRRVKFAMGPIKRIVLYIPFKRAEVRARSLGNLCRTIQFAFNEYEMETTIVGHIRSRTK